MAIKIDYSSYPDRERRKAFSDKLIPESPYKSVGVPIPEIRKIVKTLTTQDIEVNYIEDIILKGLFIVTSKQTSFNEKIPLLEEFYPYIVSWMVTDALASSIYLKKEEREEAFSYFFSLIDREENMTRRFGIITLLSNFFDELHWKQIIDKIAPIRSEHYLLNMAIAWSVSVAYAKYKRDADYCFALLSEPVKKMAKQKCRDSKRVSPEDKERLKEL